MRGLRRRRVFGSEHRLLGRRGERLAARWLRRQKYRILERNYRLGDDEADLIAVDPDGTTVVIVEVKTRSQALPAPEIRLDQRKRYRMTRLAARLAKQRRMEGRPIRLDAITILWPAGEEPQLRHYPGAFESPI